MRVLVAGAGGAIGRFLLPALREAGHEPLGLARSEEGAERARDTGVPAVVADALDASATARAVEQAAPEAIVNELTAIPSALNPRRLARQFETTNRLRIEGTANLLLAGDQAGVRRHLAQSIAFAYAPRGELVKDEDAPLYLDAPSSFRPNVEAVGELERRTLEAGGIVLRYGYFYGPGTTYARDGQTAREVARRRLPIVGSGDGLFSFVHLRDAAAATVAALERSGPSAYNVVDDTPARAAEWISEIARLLDAKPPRHVPTVVGRVIAGRWAVEYMERQRGASNAKAKAELGWQPAFASWREGFRAELRPEA